MKKSIPLILISLLTITNPAISQTNHKTNTKQMETNSSKQVVEAFFNAFGKGDFEGILNSFDDQCLIYAVHEKERAEKQLYGKYKGKEGVKSFISGLGGTFDTKSFTVDHIISEGEVVFANGKFSHVVKTTGKTFSSNWALKCLIKNNKIIEYRFYEDSAAFVEASK